jgi:hypothetical protein
MLCNLQGLFNTQQEDAYASISVGVYLMESRIASGCRDDHPCGELPQALLGQVNRCGCRGRNSSSKILNPYQSTVSDRQTSQRAHFSGLHSTSRSEWCAPHENFLFARHLASWGKIPCLGRRVGTRLSSSSLHCFLSRAGDILAEFRPAFSANIWSQGRGSHF